MSLQKNKVKVVKKRKKRIIPINTTEDLLKVINKVQLNENKKQFKIGIPDNNLSIVAENIMLDCNVKFEVYETSRRRVYTLTYEREEFLDNLILDEVEDEILENGQLF